jgi:hypothetical protein
MSDSNLSTLAGVAESAWGQTPASPSLRKLRITGESIVHDKVTVVSEEIRDDRQISDMPEVGAEASGSIDFELSYEAFKEFFEAGMFNALIVINETATCDIDAGVKAAQTLTLSANLSADDEIEVGGVVYIAKATPTLPNHFDLGASAELTIDSLVAAINKAAVGAGTLYGEGTVAHPRVTAAKASASTMTVTAKSEGTAGNAITVSEDSANAAWGDVTLEGGLEPRITGTAGDFTNIPVGATVKVAGSATSGNNGLKLVTARAGDASWIEVARGSLAADTSTEALTFTGKHLPNGTTRKSFLLERRILNSVADAYYQIYRGMMVDTLSLTFESRAIVTGSIGFLGRAGEDGGTTSIDADGVYTAAHEGDVVNATSHVGTFLIDREVTSERFKTITLDIANNLRGKDAIGESGNFDVGVGSFSLSGSLNAYFIDRAFHEKFIAHDDVAISFRVTSPQGATIVFTIPRLKLSAGTPSIEGKDTDVMTAGEFTAIRDATTGFTFAVDYHDAA